MATHTDGSFLKTMSALGAAGRGLEAFQLAAGFPAKFELKVSDRIPPHAEGPPAAARIYQPQGPGPSPPC
jgi:hypothetical protein